MIFCNPPWEWNNLLLQVTDYPHKYFNLIHLQPHSEFNPPKRSTPPLIRLMSGFLPCCHTHRSLLTRVRFSSSTGASSSSLLPLPWARFPFRSGRSGKSWGYAGDPSAGRTAAPKCTGRWSRRGAEIKQSNKMKSPAWVGLSPRFFAPFLLLASFCWLCSAAAFVHTPPQSPVLQSSSFCLPSTVLPRLFYFFLLFLPSPLLLAGFRLPMLLWHVFASVAFTFAGRPSILPQCWCHGYWHCSQTKEPPFEPVPPPKSSTDCWLHLPPGRSLPPSPYIFYF